MSVSSLNFNVLDTLMKENIKKIVIEAVRQDRAKVLVNSFNEWRVKVGCQVFVGSGVSSIGMSEQAIFKFLILKNGWFAPGRRNLRI